MLPTTIPLHWPFYPSVIIGLIVLTGGYLLAVTRWRARFPESRPVPPWRIAAFLAGIAFLFVALQTPIDQLSDDYLFSVHMAQHLLLTLIGPPLLLYGTPGWLIRPLFVRWPALLFVGRVLTGPLVAFGLFNAVFLGYHVPSLYDAILASEALHAAAHLAFIVTALITWWPVLGPLPDLLPRLPYPGQMLYLFVQTQPAQILGAMLTFADSALYRPYVAAPRVWESVTPLVDQQLGGLVMWVGGGTFFLGVFVAVFLRWAQLNERADGQGAPSRV